MARWLNGGDAHAGQVSRPRMINSAHCKKKRWVADVLLDK